MANETENFYLLQTIDDTTSQQLKTKYAQLGMDKEIFAMMVDECESFSQVYEGLVEGYQVDPDKAYQAVMEVLGLVDEDEDPIGSDLHKLLDTHFKQCGNNTDWSVKAWHVSPGEPNKREGDHYITDDECLKISMVRRWYEKENGITQVIMSFDFEGLSEADCVNSLNILIETAKSYDSIWQKKRP